MKFGIAWTAEVRNNPEFVAGEVSMLRAQEKLFFPFVVLLFFCENLVL